MSFSKRAKKLDLAFHGCRFAVTTGSLMVPALLSIQYINNVWWIDPSIFQIQIYWATWTISLIVTICNGIMTLFKFDKAYYFTHTTLELLKSEGWQYIALTGKYATKEDSKEEATHYNQFRVFYANAERIKLRQVEEEYYKFTDLPQTTNQANGKPMIAQQTPSGPQPALPNQQKTTLDGWAQEFKGNSLMDSFISPKMRRTNTGLQPRNSRPPVDGAPSAAVAIAEIPRITEVSGVSVQPEVRAETNAGETVVRSSSMSTIPENTVVPVMPEQSPQRFGTTAEYGGVEQPARVEREP